MEYSKKAKSEKLEDLTVWKKSHQMVLIIYKITKSYPIEERFSLVSQMRKAAISIPSNIAEGFKKSGTKDKINSYNIAHGSLEELRYYIILSKDLEYLQNNKNIFYVIEEIVKMLHALILSVESRKTIDETREYIY